MFRLELFSGIDGVVDAIHKAEGQWCLPADEVLTIRSGELNHALRAPALGEIAKV